jgi:lipopolysaccharide transport system ATP-binding protein
MSTVIKVENLSKKYTLRHEQAERYVALRDMIARWGRTFGKKICSPFTLHHSPFTESKEEFFALKDVSFEVKQGESVGIIGRNGAGKSTLLKLLGRITEPTSGRISIKGRVASLLEVGTGFHPELTGRENIFLNGAILGMTKAEIKRKFDEIVAFAEVEKFLDTPVKHFSSGMYVRLAFAVAAHLEPEIFIVDEVLAVGDAQFQKKCLGKMEEVGKEGRTVIVVSHQMPMIRNLCSSCFLLNNGEITETGSPEKVIPYYLQSSKVTSTQWLCTDREASSKGLPYFTLSRFALVDGQNFPLPAMIDEWGESYVVIEGTIYKPDYRLCMGFNLFDVHGTNLFLSFQTDQPSGAWPKLDEGDFSIRTKVDFSILNEGIYRLDFLSGIHCERMLHVDEVSIGFEVNGNTSHSPYWLSRRSTLLAPALRWEAF